MQELLGRLTALDPDASQVLRVIACFDELMAGGVAVHGLLSAAAALSGASAGLDRGDHVVRVDPRGESMPAGAGADAPRLQCPVSEGAVVWIERDPAQLLPNDAIILERLALALRVRLDPHMDVSMLRRDVSTVVDAAATTAERREAAGRLRITASAPHRVLAAPLFATWAEHPAGPDDVVATPYGPVHITIVGADADASGSPLGLGVAAGVDDLPASLRTALIALRLHDGTSTAPFCADDLGGLAEVLADLDDTDRPDRDAAGLSQVIDHPWGQATIDALVRASSVREAARLAGVHHSTMAMRVDAIGQALGFDPMSGLGRTRLGLAFLRWRLRESHVLVLPAPAR